jgi:hypothetical protein
MIQGILFSTFHKRVIGNVGFLREDEKSLKLCSLSPEALFSNASDIFYLYKVK